MKHSIVVVLENLLINFSKPESCDDLIKFYLQNLKSVNRDFSVLVTSEKEETKYRLKKSTLRVFTYSELSSSPILTGTKFPILLDPFVVCRILQECLSLINGLEKRNETLSSRKTTLQTELIKKESSYDELHRTYMSLLGKYQELQKEHKELNKKYQDHLVTSIQESEERQKILNDLTKITDQHQKEIKKLSEFSKQLFSYRRPWYVKLKDKFKKD